MPTIESRDIVDNLIKNNGIYGDDESGYDPPVKWILQYTNDWGGTCYFLAYDQRQLNAALLSPSVHNPILIFTRQE